MTETNRQTVTAAGTAPRTTIIIEIEGGVHSVSTETIPYGVEVLVIDRDDIEQGGHGHYIYESNETERSAR